MKSYVSELALIFFSVTASEIFDKTFFIVILLGFTTKSWVQVFLGSYIGLISMTVIICLMGNHLSKYFSKFTFQVVSSVLFFLFSLQIFFNLFKEKKKSSCEEAEEEIKKLNFKHKLFTLYPIFFKTFILTVLSEFGDKSQIASFMLSSTYSFSIVIFASLFAYAFCIGLAILINFFGKCNINEFYIQMLSGFFFLFASFYTIYEIFF
ncbi:transmembrane protein, putative [Plasmodium gallinaceum]|uniref:GDT1 family protein n=1 Tax=Plasmodium gallinaceum TaxID=5849 RepID=A0A1J1GN38_PLAGA|nr:transmembrane protein, putative [Plasmodium gallinaceum]CRG93850.1 transmembrane protein, putative [Plasmodium gallinaceum]